MKRLTIVLLAATGWALSGAAAGAQDTGMDGLHDQRRERGYRCMVDHFHVGTSAGQPTKKQAEAGAIRDWAGFTAWEYGDRWGDYRIAGSKSMKCEQAGGSWTCEVNARPCRRGK